ncbi:MAG: ABC transporter ATP-binding protein [Candidatus Obscuribacterales bacterium]|nr:ABC transporter ATP-binding protein [Candidatus Obscuribacterales bacterium]
MTGYRSNEINGDDGRVAPSEGLQIIGITAGYESNSKVLSNIDLAIAKSRVMVLAGPNGCGKSTLIKVVARHLKPESGTVLLDGCDIQSISRDQYARKVAYVPQSIDFSSQLTVEELVSLGRNPHQSWWSWSENHQDREAVEQALTRAGLTDLAKRPLTNLSGGEQKRALIAVALAQQPSYILMDEPIAHLDFKHQLSLLTMISELKEKGIGVLLVLHDLNMIDRIADDIAFLKPSQAGATTLFSAGDKESVLTSRAVSEIFEVNVDIYADKSRQGRHFSIESI